MNLKLCVLAASLAVSGCGLMTDDEARIARAKTAYSAGEYRAAIIDLKNVLSNLPDHAEARLLLGQALYATDDMSGAEKELERAVGLGIPLDDVRVNLAWIKAALGKSEEALGLADVDRVETDNERYWLCMTRGIAFVQLNKPAGALENFAAADTFGIDPVTPLIASAQVHLEADEHSEAEQLLSEALSRVPDDPNALFAIAFLLLKQHEAAAVEQILQDALENVSLTRKERSAFLELLIEANIVQADLAGTEQLMPELESLRPARDPALQLLHGRVQLAQGDFTGAIDTLSRLVKENSGDLRAQLLLGAAYLGREQLGLAYTFILSVAQELPDSPEVNVLLTELQSRKLPWAHGKVFAIESDDSEARGAAMSRRADILLGLSQSGTAEIDTAPLENWVQDYPGDAAMRAMLANASLGAGRYEDAREHYETLLRQYPDEPMILNNLAWVYNELGNPRAAETAARANELMPNNANILDTLGWIQVNNGNPQKAVSSLGRAYVMSGELPIIGYHLAYAQIESGKIEAARSLIDDLLDTPSVPPPLRTSIEILAERLGNR